MRVWILMTACALCLAGARAAHADDTLERSSRGDKVATTAMAVTYGTTFLVQMYDVRTTMNAIDAGAREINPLLTPFSTHSGTVIALGLARATAIDLAVRSIGRRNKWAAVAAGAAVNCGYLLVASHNNTVASQMRAQQAGRR
jgi:hypothetical protein